MNTMNGSMGRMILAGVLAASLTACASAPVKPKGSDELRSRLTQLQSDPQLSSRAAVAIKDAEAAVVAAEKPQKDEALGQHLVLMADRKIQIAQARAQSRLLEDQRATLSEEREGARLDSRTREVAMAQQGAAAARAESAELQQQIAELNARETERGLVITLGDVLFATGQSQLREGSSGHLNKLATFLRENPDRTVLIEGHTDNVGSEQMNSALSQRRADAVKRYLVSQGIASDRLDTIGKGEGSPVATNESASGRQQNRRVEIIIVNMATSSR